MRLATSRQLAPKHGPAPFETGRFHREEAIEHPAAAAVLGSDPLRLA